MAGKGMVVSGRSGPVVKVNCLCKMGSRICQAVHGICWCGDKVIICDRKRNILIQVDVSDGDVKEFSGKGDSKSADGCSSFCCFSRPFLVCCEENSVCYWQGISDCMNHYFIKAAYQLFNDFAMFQQSLWNSL